MTFLEIVLNIPLNQTFTYSYVPPENEKDELKPEVGKRAEVRLGNRKMTGFIIALYDHIPSSCPVGEEKIRHITKIIDEEPLFTDEIFEMAQWLSCYYVCSIGEALFAMIPSTGKRESSYPSFAFESDISEKSTAILSDEQTRAVDEIISQSEKNIYHYLYGPTGTGKTEVFLQAAERVLAQGKGVIYLVPEIGLTPQVVKAVQSRFGNTAAILHSALTPSQKLTQWKKIMRRESRIAIGARSAVFAPMPDLGLIIIDEEHDGSYKSGDTPRYHARQFAMYRCSRLKIPLVMGSATPSVEAYHFMKQGKIIRHTLTKRLAGGEMPSIKTINLSAIPSSGCISKELEDEIRRTVENKRQVILFLNRRGFNHFFRCNSCGYELLCKNCSVPMTYHIKDNRLRCHYCNWSIVPPVSCPVCGSVDIGYSGFGTEYIEVEARTKFPNSRIIRIDRDSLTKKGELEKALDDFRRGEYDIMLGTQMIAKGLNFPNLQLVGVVLADTALHLPDFRAAERTFSLITQVAGRAGRYFPDGKVFVQTYNPFCEPIKYACEGDVNAFYQYELSQRKTQCFPPFSRLVRLVFRSAFQNVAEANAEQAAKILSDFLGENGEVLGPAECPILLIAKNYRYQILLRGQTITPLQNAAEHLLRSYNHPQNVYIECDVDPVSLI
ncbi:MAG: primosomal protein N' [Treponema sp.]|nr:primosomal protein N' [Treponema sp.]